MTNVQMKLKEIRKERGYTQKEMAVFLGISQQAYQQIEAGRTEDMRISTLRKLCFLLQVSADELLEISPLTIQAEEIFDIGSITKRVKEIDIEALKAKGLRPARHK